MNKSRLGSGRVAFLAHLEPIRKEIEAGWTMQAVFDTHGPKLGITYSQFTRYVARFIKEKPHQSQKPEIKAKAVIPESFSFPDISSKPKPYPLFEATPPPDQELF